MDIGICTTVWGDYHKYLLPWAKAISKLHTPPTQVHIAVEDNDNFTHEIADALHVFISDLEITVTPRLSPASMRNLAVSKLDTEWVMFADVDDLLLPECIDLCAEVEGADVIALGYKKMVDGEIKGTRIYEPLEGIDALMAPRICPSLSPYRKSLWEKQPYFDFADNKGGWDYALWIKFIHMGARFVPTTKPGFIYNIHEDSVFQQRLKGHHRDGTTKVGEALGELRWGGDWPVSFLIPYSNDCPYRDKAKDFVIEHILEGFPNSEVFCGGAYGDFCKGEAVNGLFEMSTGSIVVVLDADCVLSIAAIKEGIEFAKREPWVVPHTQVFRFSEKSSENFMGNFPYEEDYTREPYQGVAGGGCFIINKWNFRKVGGMDEDFKGWGGEDYCFGLLADSVLGKHIRMPHPLIHLWHPPQPTKHGAYGDNGGIGEAYRRNSKNLDWMFDKARELRERQGWGDCYKDYFYVCSDTKFFRRLYPRDEIRWDDAGKNKVTKLHQGVLRTVAPPYIMKPFRCVEQISEQQYNERKKDE